MTPGKALHHNDTSIIAFLKNTLFILILCGFFFSISAQNPVSIDWLEDQPPVDRITRVQVNKLSEITKYPRKSTGSMKQGLSSQQMSCFDIVCRKPFGDVISGIAAAQAINPNLTWLRIYCPQEWQGAADGLNKQGNGYPFNTSGPSTANNQIFPGHWAYKPFTTLSQDISADINLVISVANAANIANGTYYYVIRPHDSWENAEQVRIVKSGSTITINQRGYKSEARSWPAGSIIAQHQLGNGAGNLNWVYNLSTESPLDANGKKGYEVFSAWLAENYDRDGNGNPTSAIDGILYDSDFYQFADGGGSASRNADLDNDGISDWGLYTNGNNFWGEGMELFYKGVRDGLDARGRTNAIIVGGVADSWGVIPNNGTQLEAAWSHQFGESGAKAGNYNHIGFYIALMKAHTGHGVIGPRVTDVQGKEASAIYPASSGETRNAPVRFSYSMSMMFDGTWFSNQNGFDDPFHYFDEDAVYLSHDSNYGKSVLRTNYEDIRNNNKWLGEALGQYKRVYNPADFELSKNLVPNGNFEEALSGWSGTNARLTLVSDEKYEGGSSLLVTPNKPVSSRDISSATAIGPAISLTANKEYSICFAINSEHHVRKIRVRIGALSQTLFIPPGWSKHVLSWRQTASENSTLKFDVGIELTELWLDQLYVFEGSTDVFRRDFENGIILANATPLPKTIDLNGVFQRINGNLDTQANSGETGITQVTLPAYDGLFMVRAMPTSAEKYGHNDFTVYPNPFNSYFRIELPVKSKSIEVYDLLGKSVYKQTIADNTTSLVVENMAQKASGVYLIDVKTENGSHKISLVKE